MIKNTIGITTAAGYNFPYEERFRLYKEYGFSTVMIGWEEDNTPRKQRVSLALKAGLEIENVHSDFSHTNCLWKDDVSGEAKLENLIKSLEDCAAYGVPVMVMHLSNSADIPDVTDIGLFRFQTLLEKAVRLNVTLAVENVRTERHVRYVLEHFNDSHLKFCWDCGHENIWTNGLDWLSLYSSRLGAIHIHDNNGVNDDHLVPFEGKINWKKTAEKLKKTSYSGSLTLECEYYGSDENELRNMLERANCAGKELLNYIIF